MLEPQSLRVITFQREGGTLALDDRLEVGCRLPALGGEQLGIAERDAGALALAPNRGLALADGPDLFAQPHRLLAELADLDAHLFAPLEEPLELALHLRDRLPQIGEAVLALLQGFAGSSLTGRQRRDARLQRLLTVAEPLEL